MNKIAGGWLQGFIDTCKAYGVAPGVILKNAQALPSKNTVAADADEFTSNDPVKKTVPVTPAPVKPVTPVPAKPAPAPAASSSIFGNLFDTAKKQLFAGEELDKRMADYTSGMTNTPTADAALSGADVGANKAIATPSADARRKQIEAEQYANYQKGYGDEYVKAAPDLAKYNLNMTTNPLARAEDAMPMTYGTWQDGRASRKWRDDLERRQAELDLEQSRNMTPQSATNQVNNLNAQTSVYGARAARERARNMLGR